MNSIIELKNIHCNDDIWVLGSGPSLNHIDPSFFDNKIVIGTNRIGQWIRCNYIVAKDSRGFGEIKKCIGNPHIIISEYTHGNQAHEKNVFNGPCHIFQHLQNIEVPRTEIIGTDKIVVSHSTITSALHIAAYMGAKNSILVGHDCGSIDGKYTIDGYYNDITPAQGENNYKKWVSKDIESHTITVINKLKEVYGVNVHSLNPFINFGLEDHSYEK